MHGKARSRHGALETVRARWHRALPLLTASLLLLPGGVAFASEPIAGPTTASLIQSETERRCLVRCNEPERPKPGARLQEAASKAKTVVQDAREDVRQAAQDAREAAGRVKEAAGEAKEAVGEIAEASDDPKAALGEMKEGAGEVKDALTEPTEQTEAADAEPAAEPAPAEAAAPEPAPAAEPTPATETAPASEPAPAPSTSTAVASAAPAQAPQPGLSVQPDASSQAAAPRADGVAGGPNVASQRPGSGTLGQGNGTDPVAQADPAPAAPATTEPAPSAAAPPSVQPEAPVGAQAPPVAPAAAAPAPADVSTASKPSNESDATVKLAGWSVPLPLAVVGGLLAGLVIAVPVVRRQRALAPAPVESRALPRHDDSLRTYPGIETPAPGAAPTLLTRPVRPVQDSVANASHARLNGSPVPYLRPVPNRSDDRRAHVAGAPEPSWSTASTRGRSGRALA